MKSKHIMMCSSVIVAAFVSVLLYSSDGLGMIAVAAAAETATVAAGGGEEGETNGTMMTVLDGVPATATAPRKLTKKSKASNDGVSLSQEVRRLLGRLVFEKAMELCRFVQPSSDDAARADNDGRALFEGGWLAISGAIKQACEECLNFLWDQQYITGNQQGTFCQNVLIMMDSSESPYSDVQKSYMMDYCMSFSQCASQNTRTACCQSHSTCLSPGPAGAPCSGIADCAVPTGLARPVCRQGKCQSGVYKDYCGQDSDCLSNNCVGVTGIAKCKN